MAFDQISPVAAPASHPHAPHPDALHPGSSHV